jgi:hypothetical protein
MQNKIQEDGVGPVATNNAGAGAIDGIGVTANGAKGEPGMPKRKLRDMLKRKSLKDITSVPGQ